MKFKNLRLAVFFLAILVFAFGCTSQNNLDINTSSIPTKEFDIIAKRFSFYPPIIEVNKGDFVKLRVTSADVAHGISIPAFSVQEYLPTGETVEITFVADKTGEFSFACSVFCGNAHSAMIGKIIVR